jgi:hypothetical protein
MKQYWKQIVWSLAAIGILAAIELLTPKPIDWRETYERDDKIPYGEYAVFSLLKSIFPQSHIIENEKTIYETLADSAFKNTNYIVITNVFDVQNEDLAELLHFVENGNSVFLAAENMMVNFKDSLGLEIDENYSLASDSLLSNFTNVSLKSEKKYAFKNRVSSYFHKFDTTASVVLGQNSSGQPDFLKIRRGDGAFYINLIPQAFTNYYLLRNNNAEYLSKALSYLPVQATLWDEYYKPFRRAEKQSSLRYLLDQSAFRWAWYLMLGGVLAFVIFRGKRTQRIIPIVEPLKNSTVEFAETVGTLYFQHGNHKNLSEKKIRFFFDYLRTAFYEPNIEINEEFLKRITEKSGVDRVSVTKLFNYITSLQQRKHLDEEQVLTLNRLIDDFKKRSLR